MNPTSSYIRRNLYSFYVAFKFPKRFFEKTKIVEQLFWKPDLLSGHSQIKLYSN